MVHTPPEDLEAKVFEIVNQLNSGAALMTAANDPLDSLQAAAEDVLGSALKLEFNQVVASVRAQLGFIRALRGATASLDAFGGEQLDEAQFERELEDDARLRSPACWYWIRKLQARCLAGDTAGALAAAAKAQQHFFTSLTPFEEVEFHTYAALARAAHCRALPADAQAAEREALQAHARWLDGFAGHNPDSGRNRALLVHAEIARLEGRDMDALRLYEQAMRSAREHGFVQVEAIAHELAADFHSAQGLDTSARALLRHACHAYRRWGAQAKVRQLEAHHAFLRLQADNGAVDATISTSGPDALGAQAAISVEHARHADLRDREERIRQLLDSSLSERKQAEAERSARQVDEAANQAMSTHLANMSHELRTPLNGILGFAQILRQDDTLTQPQARAVQVIDESAQHLLALINDILDLARMHSARLELQAEAVDLPQFLQLVCDIVRARAEEKDLLFVCDADADLPATVLVDGRRLRQVLLNLLSNAVKFTDAGRVRLRVTRVGASSAAATTARLRFEVEDSGIGMDEAQVARLFTPFEQVADTGHREGGTGLGLVISRQLVQMMGGDIAVHSRPGLGSSFSFEIEVTASPTAVQQPTAAAPPAGYTGPRRKILVVDDVPQNRGMLVDMLAPLGFQVAEAADGEAALESVASFQPDLVLMDLVMPVMDGIEATRRLRAAPATALLPIIATSAGATPETEARSRSAGADEFLAKPMSQPALFDALGTLLGLMWIPGPPAPAPALAPHVAPAAATPAHAAADLVPAPELVAELRELARLGNMRRIGAWADRVMALDPRYQPFTTRIKSLAAAYESKAILTLAERFAAESG